MSVACKDALARIRDAVEGDRNATMSRAVSALVARGLWNDDVHDRVVDACERANPDDPKGAAKAVRDAARGAQGKVDSGGWQARDGASQGRDTDEPSYADVVARGTHGQLGLGFASDAKTRLDALPEDPAEQEGLVRPDPKVHALIAPMSEWGLDCCLAFIHTRIRMSLRGGKRIQWRNGRRTEHGWKTIEDEGIDKVVELLARRCRQVKHTKHGKEYFVRWRISGQRFIEWSRARCFDHRRVDPFLAWAHECKEDPAGPAIVASAGRRCAMGTGRPRRLHPTRPS